MSCAVPAGQRIYAVGDVHGCRHLLDRLLARIDSDLSERPVARASEVFLGDYVDRGPDSAGVLERLSQPPRGRDRVCLMGNHEEVMLEALDDDAAMDRWLRFGGDATVRSYGLDPGVRWDGSAALRTALRAAIPAAHLAFLRTLVVAHRVGDTLFVHAGIRPGVPLEAQTRQDLLWIREPFLDHDGPLPLRIVHGHTPVESARVHPQRINIDTGAVYGGALTAVALEEGNLRVLSVSA